ncbi:Uncharacterised protein [Acinetobacter baumannii]|nr:Uncharacterised protein [Acinetobacter baumannii]
MDDLKKYARDELHLFESQKLLDLKSLKQLVFFQGNMK